jgi:hypothetical protein
MKKNILIIDNQQHDYELIHKELGKHHFVFPDIKEPKEFVEVMDYIRIILLKDAYGEVRHRDALKRLVEYIGSKKIDLLIVDYKLSGSVEGDTGIELVMELTGQLGLQDLKYIFLTRTLRSMDSVEKN